LTMSYSMVWIKLEAVIPLPPQLKVIENI
jgi:hypothetical protein